MIFAELRQQVEQERQHMRRERDAARRQSRRERIRGGFVDGTPRDPGHGWYQGDPALRPRPGEKVN